MINKIIKYIIILIYAFCSSWCFTVSLLCGFNYQKGIAINDDGIMLIPIGMLVCLTTLIIYFFLIRRIVKSKNKTKFEKVIVISSFFILVVVGILLTLDGYKLFFHCFIFYKGLPNVSRYC